MIRKLSRWHKSRKERREAKKLAEATLLVTNQIIGDEHDWQALVPMMNRLLSGRESHEATEQLVRLFRHITAQNTHREKQILANCVRQAGHRMRPKGKSK